MKFLYKINTSKFLKEGQAMFLQCLNDFWGEKSLYFSKTLEVLLYKFYFILEHYSPLFIIAGVIIESTILNQNLIFLIFLIFCFFNLFFLSKIQIIYQKYNYGRIFSICLYLQKALFYLILGFLSSYFASSKHLQMKIDNDILASKYVVLKGFVNKMGLGNKNVLYVENISLNPYKEDLNKSLEGEETKNMTNYKNCHGLVYLDKNDNQINHILNNGDIVLVKIRLARLKNIKFKKNKFFTNSSKICIRGFASEYKIIDKTNSNTLLNKITKIRINFFNKLNQYKISEKYSESHKGIIMAIIFGNKSMISYDVLDLFSKLGISHILAISGLHLTIVLGSLFKIFRYILSYSEYICLNWNTKRISGILSILLGSIYILCTSGSISIIRSFVMLCIFILYVILQKNISTFRIWFNALWMISLVYPKSIFTPSFQMSFAATFGLIYFLSNSRAQEFMFLGFVKTKLIRYITSITSSSFIASIITLPFEMLHFGQITILGIFMNIIAIPIAEFIIIPFSFIASIFSNLKLNFLFEKFLNISIIGTDVLLKTANFINKIPFTSHQLHTISPISSLICMIGSIIILYNKVSRYSILGFGIIIFSILGIKSPNPNIVVSRKFLLLFDQKQYLGLNKVTKYISNQIKRKSGYDVNLIMNDKKFKRVKISNKKNSYICFFGDKENKVNYNLYTKELMKHNCSINAYYHSKRKGFIILTKQRYYNLDLENSKIYSIFINKKNEIEILY